VPPEDALAFFRADWAFRNARLVEAENGDFGETVSRLLVFATWRLALLGRLSASRDAVLRAVATKGVKEVTYHRDFAARWFVTLAQGTPESRRRVIAGLDQAWRYHDELFLAHPVERELAAAGVAADPASIAAEAGAVLDQVFAAGDVQRPSVPRAGLARLAGGPDGQGGRDGIHTEALSRMLALMQSVARAHPRGRW
jgi:ring-1,2-phenylacetyl-CoA epoxidase subunit PaaC